MEYKEKQKYFFFLILFFIFSEAFASDPKFDLRLTNRNYISSNEGYFDIVLKQTNPDQTDFLYAGGEYIIILNTDFQSEHLNYTYSIDTATYGTERIPPRYIGSLTKNYDTLKLAQGDSISPGNEPVISATTGTLVARIRFYNPDLYSNSCLLEDQFSWKTGIPGDYTKLYFRRNGVTNLINNNFSLFSTYDLCISTFCCLEAPLHPPVRISPENNTTDLSAPVTLQWRKGFPVNYSAYLQISEDSGFSNVIFDSSLTAPNGSDDIFVTLTSLTNPGSYYWRVKQGGIPPQGAYNEPWKFTIAPGSITLKLTAIPEGLYRYNNFREEFKVYLRNSSAPFELIDSCIFTSEDSSFQNILNFRNANSGSYYVIVNIPGCIDTWSKEGGVYLSRGSVINEYDFSFNQSQAYCSNQILVKDKYCIYSGEVNQDGIVDLKDQIETYTHSNIFNSGYIHTDLTGDNITDLNDIIIARNNAESFTQAQFPLLKFHNRLYTGK